MSPSHNPGTSLKQAPFLEWGATKKEVERSNFFLEVPKILVRFRVALVLCFLTAVGMVVLAMPFLPAEWAIRNYEWSGA